MLGDFASLDVQNTYRGSDAYAREFICMNMNSLLSVALQMTEGAFFV
ncbi:hypothetical protein [Piscirickettsia salmonis]|nr:hypothetical protein [Piscirickettsia salmonis]